MCNSVKIDPKGRLKIPVNLLAALKGFDAEFYVTSDSGDSLRIYPMQVWHQIEERLERLCLRNGSYRKILARAKYFGQAVALDKQGRVLIPISLRRIAQIKGMVDVFDYLNYLEVWNHSRFLKSIRSNPITAQDESLLKEQLASVSRFPSLAFRKKKKERAQRKMRRFGSRRRLRSGSHVQAVHAIRGARSDPPQRVRVA